MCKECETEPPTPLPTPAPIEAPTPITPAPTPMPVTPMPTPNPTEAPVTSSCLDDYNNWITCLDNDDTDDCALCMRQPSEGIDETFFVPEVCNDNFLGW